MSPSVSPEVVPGNVEPSNDSIESLSSPASPTTHETVSRVKLPKFEFKQFDGDVYYALCMHAKMAATLVRAQCISF